jgi:16S rRNA (guanine527-N7)-methyltransferase
LQSTLIDLGSGAGFPGLPLKIIRPDLSVTLVDASLKKIMFLRYLVRLLDIHGVAVLQKRLEEHGIAENFYDVCIGRAVASLEKFLPLAAFLRAPHGIIIAMKGPNFSSELKLIEPRLPRLGISLKKIQSFLLPFSQKERVIIIFG